ncbi:MAG: hypothetical protein H6791_02890 [Candidatus Nomurabacteria bacterium]|nr:MAG: hypothetical protein H6791_02890 [Candidatus Nomurabacteria bacterium]
MPSIFRNSSIRNILLFAFTFSILVLFPLNKASASTWEMEDVFWGDPSILGDYGTFDNWKVLSNFINIYPVRNTNLSVSNVQPSSALFEFSLGFSNDSTPGAVVNATAGVPTGFGDYHGWDSLFVSGADDKWETRYGGGFLGRKNGIFLVVSQSKTTLYNYFEAEGSPVNLGNTDDSKKLVNSAPGTGDGYIPTTIQTIDCFFENSEELDDCPWTGGTLGELGFAGGGEINFETTPEFVLLSEMGEAGWDNYKNFEIANIPTEDTYEASKNQRVIPISPTFSQLTVGAIDATEITNINSFVFTVPNLEPGKPYYAQLVIVEDAGLSGTDQRVGFGPLKTFVTPAGEAAPLSEDSYIYETSSFEQNDRNIILSGLDCGFGTAALGGKESNFQSCIIITLYYVVYMPSATLLYVVGSFFDAFLSFSISSYIYKDPSFVQEGWRIIKNFANIGFILTLVWAGISTILGGRTNVRKVIVNVIIFGLLINFSLFFTQVVIDAGNVLAKIFYNQISITGDPINTVTSTDSIGQTKSLSAGVVQGTKIQTIFSRETVSALRQGDFGGASTWAVPAIIIIFGIILNITLIFIFIKVAMVFLGRIVGLWVMMIASPFAFLSKALDQGSIASGEFGMKKWSYSLVRLTFLAPLFLFFLYLIILFINSDFIGGLVKSENLNFYELMLSIALQFLIVIALLKQARDITIDMSGKFGKQVVETGTKLVGTALGVAGGVALGATAFGLRATAGRIAATAGESETAKKWANSKNFFTRQIGTGITKTGKAAKESSFDLRQTGLGGKLQSSLGKNLGAGVNFDQKGIGFGSNAGKGGLAAIEKRKKKAKIKEMESHIESRKMSKDWFEEELTDKDGNKKKRGVLYQEKKLEKYNKDKQRFIEDQIIKLAREKGQNIDTKTVRDPLALASLAKRINFEEKDAVEKFEKQRGKTVSVKDNVDDLNKDLRNQYLDRRKSTDGWKKTGNMLLRNPQGVGGQSLDRRAEVAAAKAVGEKYDKKESSKGAKDKLKEKRDRLQEKVGKVEETLKKLLDVTTKEGEKMAELVRLEGERKGRELNEAEKRSYILNVEKQNKKADMDLKRDMVKLLRAKHNATNDTAEKDRINGEIRDLYREIGEHEVEAKTIEDYEKNKNDLAEVDTKLNREEGGGSNPSSGETKK